MTGQDVIEGQIVAVQAAILAGIAIPPEDFAAG